MALFSGICKPSDGEPCIDCFEMGEMDLRETILGWAAEPRAQAVHPS